jgi:hypothetical protein
MASSVQVSCINKRDRQSPHERISHIGGTNPNGSAWKLSEDDAIAGIKAGTWSFFVNVRSQRVAVIIAKHLGREYLKTEADGVEPNNLLSLPECP